jgi:hypothetical protein
LLLRIIKSNKITSFSKLLEVVLEEKRREIIKEWMGGKIKTHSK